MTSSTALILVLLQGMGIWNLPWQKLRTLGAKLANEPGKSRIQNGDRAKCALFHYYIVQLAYSYSASGECYSGFTRRCTCEKARRRNSLTQ